jgi:hypothetical protein
MHWNDSSITDDPKIPARDEEGIDRRYWEEHRRWEEMTGISVVLSIVTIGREAELNPTTEWITPDADKLRAAIGEAFSRRPMLHWSSVLDQIADGTEVSGIDVGGAA